MKLKNVARLTLRRLRHGWKIHLAALLLTVLTGTMFMLYQSYLLQLGTELGSQTVALTMLSDYSVELPAQDLLAGPAEVTGSWVNRPQPVLAAQGYAVTVGSTFGRLPALAIRPAASYQGPLPKDGQALVGEPLAARLGLPIGQQIDLRLPDGRQASVLLAGAYPSSDVTASLLISYDWYRSVSPSVGYNRFLFNLPNGVAPAAARSMLDRFYPTAHIVDHSQPAKLAAQAVGDTYSSGSSLVNLLFLFLAIGVLTALLLSFMDSKRELSVMKSLGLTPKELSALFYGSGLLTALVGIAAAIGMSYGLVWLISSQGVKLALATQSITGLLFWTGAAYLLAIAAPANLARVATVNQLLYDQPIPIINKRVTGLRASNPVYQGRIDRGWQIVRLPVVDGVLDGFVFKQIGDQVKSGEVLGSTIDWWGLAYTEYVATIDGTVTIWVADGGVLGIKPYHEVETPLFA